MKLKRKILSAILVATFVFTCIPTVFAQEYVLTYNDIEGKIKLPYTFTDVVPEACSDFFEELLKNPVSSKYKGAYAYDYFVIGNTFGATAASFGSAFANYKSPDVSYEEIIYVRDMYLIAAISEKDSGNILGLELLGQHNDNVTEFQHRMFDISDYFDFEKHQVIFFTYVVDFYVEGSGNLADEPKLYVFDPVYVDVDKYIYGDANKDGKINLTDVTLMLKYMAKWSTVSVDRSLLDTEHSKNAYYNCWYNMVDVSYVLKIIAGWDIAKLTETILDDPLRPSSNCVAHYIVTD